MPFPAATRIEDCIVLPSKTPTAQTIGDEMTATFWLFSQWRGIEAMG